MKQYEAVINTLEKLGGQATLAELYCEVMKIGDCKWETKTPFASIRRIVQVRPEIFKVRPGLWALRSYQTRLSLSEYSKTKQQTTEAAQQTHSYYQGLVVIIGNLREFSTYVPNQDKNRLFVDRPLKEMRSLQTIPSFSYDYFVKRSETVDVLWFNGRLMPNSFFEIEHSTDIQNSLLKFQDLQDFHARMVIVANEHRQAEFEQKMNRRPFDEFKERVKFLTYGTLVRQYEYEVYKNSQTFVV